MADIQHRDIPDSERHELKGASTAIAGAVPVANGSGGTSFQKLGVTSLTGSIPTSLADLLLATDGSGGFKTASSVYGAFTVAPYASTIYLQITPNFTQQGITLLPGGPSTFLHDRFVVSTTGIYLVSMSAGSLVTNAPITSILTVPVGLVQLNAGWEYRTTDACQLSIWRVAV